MRRFSYVWKSSDGERHVDEMSARRKDDVFAALRERGIRPVKVDALPRPWWWWASWCVAVLSVGASLCAVNRCRTAEQREMVNAFQAAGEAIIAQLDEQLAPLRLDDPTGSPPLSERLGKAMRSIDVARSRLRLAYRDFGGKAIPVGERLYGRFMSVLDEREETLEIVSDSLDEK